MFYHETKLEYEGRYTRPNKKKGAYALGAMRTNDAENTEIGGRPSCSIDPGARMKVSCVPCVIQSYS